MPSQLFTPGPVPLHPAVAAALAEPVIHHRTPEFEATLQKVFHLLPRIFQTREHCCVVTTTGSGAMEAAIVNTLAPGQKVLALVAGKFGERWANMAEALGLAVQRVHVPWGKDLDLTAVEELLRREQPHALFSQACETSTGALLPVQKLSLIRDRISPQTLFLVDAITALGATELPMDDWGLDVVVGGSQKALMSPTGLGVLGLSARAWHICQNGPTLPKFYWDLAEERKANLKNATRFSSATHLLKALACALEILDRVGLPQALRRTHNLQQATHVALTSLGFSSFPETPSPSLSCMRPPAGVSALKLQAHLENRYGMTLMAGQDQLQDQVIRIGHMGYLTNASMLNLFQRIQQSLIELGGSASSLPVVGPLLGQEIY